MGKPRKARPEKSNTADPNDPLSGLPRPPTHRTLFVLEAIAANPGANNRQIAELAGITDRGQISRLLAKLAGYGLIVNANPGAGPRGQANSWTLAPNAAAAVVRGAPAADPSIRG